MFGNFSLFKTPFLGQSSLPTSFVSFFHLLYFSYLFLKTMICFSGCLMSSASIQKLFCEVYSALKCSFDEFVREKVVSPSYSSAIFSFLLEFLLPWTWGISSRLLQQSTATTLCGPTCHYEPCCVGPPKMDWSWWRVLTKCGPLEKGMANHFSILALRTP